MKEKIAVVCPRSPRESYAGVENYVLNLAKGLGKRYDIDIYCTAENPKKGVRIGGAKVLEFREKRMPLGIRYYSPELIGALKESGAGIIHAAGYNTLAPMMALAAKKKSQKLVITLASSKSSSLARAMFEKPYFLAMRLLKGKVDCFIAISRFERRLFEKKLKGARFEVIPIGQNIPGRIPAGKRKKQVVSIGRLVKNKGFSHVIDAFGRLAKLDPGFRLVIIGDGADRQELEGKAKSLGLGGKVVFTGAIPYENHGRIMRCLEESCAFVFLSDYESQAMVIVEAACAGTPGIVSNKGVMKEFVDCGLALGFGQNDSEGIARKILEIYDNPAGFAPTIGRIRKCYLIKSWKEVASQTGRIYEDLLKKGR